MDPEPIGNSGENDSMTVAPAVTVNPKENLNVRRSTTLGSKPLTCLVARIVVVCLIRVLIHSWMRKKHEAKARRRLMAQRFQLMQPDDNVFMLLLLAGLTRHQREWYILPRSVHWAWGIFQEDHFTEGQFRNTFRMTRETFWELHKLLAPHIGKRVTNFRQPIPSDRRLAIFLYYVAHGASYIVLTNQFGCGKSTVCGIISDIVHAILQHLSQHYVKFPTIDGALRTIDYWRSLTGIPGVVGCIDGTQVPIVQPSFSGTAYYNRKSFYSINVQGMLSYYSA
jgi:hypothetical protein